MASNPALARRRRRATTCPLRLGAHVLVCARHRSLLSAVYDNQITLTRSSGLCAANRYATSGGSTSPALVSSSVTPGSASGARSLLRELKAHLSQRTGVNAPGRSEHLGLERTNARHKSDSRSRSDDEVWGGALRRRAAGSPLGARNCGTTGGVWTKLCPCALRALVARREAVK